MGASELISRREGGLLRLTINRPLKCNPLSRPVLGALVRALETVDEAIRCVTITGAGERYFAAGGDLRDLAAVRSEADTVAMVDSCRSALDAVRECPVPVIALVNGDAIGGGAELALACDLRLMRRGAHIGFIHGRLAITAAWGGSADLYSLIGRSRALRMSARNELVGAALALEWGLADAVYEASEAQSAIDAFLAPILQQVPQVLRAFKSQAIAARRGAGYPERRAIELDGLVRTWTAPAHWTAVERILSKEKP